MLAGTLKKPTYDEAVTAIHAVPAVKAAKDAFDVAQKDFKELKQKVDEYDRLVAPVLTSSNSPTGPLNPLEVRLAEAKLPGLRLELIQREVTLDKAQAVHQEAVNEATRALEEARIPSRKVLVGKLMDKLREARRMAMEIETYDETTSELGGHPPLCPMSELVGDRYREDIVTFGEERLRQEGWL